MKIKQLTIYTRQLQAQTAFYQETLGLTLVQQTGISASFKIGESILQLSHKYTAQPYHFAFTIPADKAPQALAWLKGKVKVLRDEKEKELVDFKAWNAESIYFYDKDRNIVEFIARKNLKVKRKEPFGPNEFLEISEIGVAVPDIKTTYQQINALKKLPIFDGDFNEFCAAGDEHGLFIIVNKNKKHWFPTRDKAHPADFIMSGDYNLEFTAGQIKMKR